MALTAAEQAELAQLRQRFGQVTGGQAISSIEAAGVRRDYAKADVPEMKARMEQLEARAQSRTGRTRGAIRFSL